MKKRLISLLLAALLLLSTAPAALAEGAFAAEREVLDFFTQQKADKAEDFEFSCEPSLFARLTADNAALLCRLQVKGGIADAQVKVSEAGGLIRFSRVQYTDAPWAECVSEKDVRRAVCALLGGKSQAFTLLCSPGLAQDLAESGRLRNFAAQAGFGSVQASYFTNGIVQVKDPEPLALDYAPAEDAAQFDAAVENFAQKELDEFYIVFAPDFYETLLDDEEAYTILHASSMLDRYSYIPESTPGLVRYYRVSYTQDPCLICRSEEDVAEAISRMGALGLTSFRLYLVGEELRAAMIDTPLGYLHDLEAKGGMAFANISHNGGMVRYTDAVITAESPSLSNPKEAAAYVEEQAAQGAERIALFCTPELFDRLMGKLGSPAASRDGMGPVYDLAAQAGILDYEISANRAVGAIVILVKEYYPGFRILLAVRNHTEDELSERDRETLDAADRLLDSCYRESTLDTVRLIHDALCKGIVYSDDETTGEDDTAVGALLRGEANCSGYSDAFYLVAGLAGLQVRCQRGESRVSGQGLILPGNPVPHMWNLLRLDGSWRLVDLTWDDSEEGPDHTWFNLGYDRASRTHLWNEDMTVTLDRETESYGRPGTEFSVHDRSEMEYAVDRALRKEFGRFCLIFDDESYVDYRAALSRIERGWKGEVRWSWGEEMRQLWVELR